MLAKGCRGSIEFTPAAEKNLSGLSREGARYSKNIRVQESVIDDEDIQKAGNVEDEMGKVGEIGKCAVCRRNSTEADLLNVALLEMNEVVPSLNDDLDLISWLISQTIEQ